MYCGKLIPKKQPLMLLEAFAKVRKDLPCALLYVGDGELRPEIEDRVAESDIPDVRITGFLNQSEISKAYTAADILVLPSTWMNGDTETWGLTINEGMNFGLPVIVTDRVGCSADLVEDHANGYVVPHDNVAALSQAIRGLVQDSEMRHAFGVRSLEIIDGWNYEKCGEGIVKALDQVCE
jgi:glycosyltransferase involved in cell wall biosynthesis